MVVRDNDDSRAVALAPALIVEDDPAMQARLRALLAGLGVEACTVACAGSLAEAQALLDAHAFAFALVDMGLPDGSGLQLIEQLRRDHPGVACMVVSAWGREDVVMAALRAGALGYLLKEREDDELAMSLRSVAAGGAPIDPSIARRVLMAFADEAVPGPEPAPPLSAREQQVLTLIARGHSNREIAGLIGLSRFTVEDYTRSIYRKLTVRSRAAAVFAGQARGLLD